MKNQEYRVGGEVDSYCGRCHTETRHVIVALVDGLPKRVECLPCHALHNYRPQPGKSAGRKTSKAKTPRARKDSGITEMLNDAEAVDYSPKTKFTPGMVVRHTKFGLGKVVGVGTRMMTIAFRDQVRKLSLTP